MSNNLCEYILGSHHELSRKFESKSFRRFLTDNFDIKVTSDLDLDKLVLPLSKIWGYRGVFKIFNPKVTLNKEKGQRICVWLTSCFVRELPWKINVTFCWYLCKIDLVSKRVQIYTLICKEINWICENITVFDFKGTQRFFNSHLKHWTRGKHCAKMKTLTFHVGKV